MTQVNTKELPTVQELREISKDRPDTFLNGALYIIDLIEKVLPAKQDGWIRVEDGQERMEDKIREIFDLLDTDSQRLIFG